MNRKNAQAWLLVAAAGACVGTAHAQVGGVVNISGATLLENFVKAPASTNDFIDVDGDGIAGYLGTFVGGIPDQLAVGGPTGLDAAGDSSDQELVVQYRVTGSVNGFIELVRFGAPTWVTSDANATDFLTAIPGAAAASGGTNPGFASNAYHNRILYIGNGTGGTVAGVRTGTYNQGNPGGAPNRSNQSTYVATYNTPDNPAAGGIQIDICPTDVSSFLAVQKLGGTPVWDARPADLGYGTNPVEMITKTGGVPSGSPLIRTNKLAELGNRNLNLSSPNANTIYDTPLLYAVIAPVTNFGTGLTQITISQLQHLYGTGRMSSGENLVAITRDSGSGTRNAFQNCIGQDPSWGRGENIGPLSASSSQNNLGSAHIPGNKGSNGNVEATTRNVRLGIGYIGAERGTTGSGSGSWLVRDGTGNSALEILAVKNDIYGGTVFARPTLSNILANSANTWVIGGQAVLATIGDPKANGAAAGGTGWVGAFDPFIDTNGNGTYELGEPFTDLNGNGVRNATNAEAGLINNNPPMANPFAAKYMNNVFRSIAAFNSVPADIDNFGMPGEFAAARFLSLAALNNLHSEQNYTTLVTNPNFNQSVQNYIVSSGTNVYANSVFASPNTAGTGKVPTRNTGTVYTDGVANGNNYINQAGSIVSYGSNLNARNKIAADFNGDGTRSASDAAGMIAAWRQRNGGPAWTAPDGIFGTGAGQNAVIEILGDFDGDGNFNKADIRYWADGLVLVGGALNRNAGFTAVDNAFGGNFFGTTKSTGASYNAGDARADVANASGLASPGWAPIGADRNNNASDADDNKIDLSDVNYILKQFNNAFVTDGAANWSNLDEAVGFDLSADMNGDLIVDQADVTDVIVNVLGTKYGDLNLDGVVTCDEKNTILLGQGTTVTTRWAGGDLNGDGLVNNEDTSALFGANGICLGDYNCDGGVDGDDVITFFADWDSASPAADVDGSGGVDGDDVILFFERWDAGC